MFRNQNACKLKDRIEVFSLKVINYWNHLTDEVVSCKSSSTFKIKLDEFMAAKEEI